MKLTHIQGVSRLRNDLRQHWDERSYLHLAWRGRELYIPCPDWLRDELYFWL